MALETSRKRVSQSLTKSSGLSKLFSLIEKKRATLKESKDANLKPKDGPPGPHTYLLTMAKRVRRPKVEKKSKEPTNSPKEPKVGTLPDADKLIQQTIVEHPEMNAATLYNTLKSKGISFGLNPDLVASNKAPGDTESKEADSASSLPQLTRAGLKKESNVSTGFSALRFLESKSPEDKSVGFTKFKTILLQEGLGNLKDAFYYTKDALKSAVSIFEGKKIYADHPTEIDEAVRPERSVRDVLGHFENVSYVESEDGRGQLTADVIIPPDQPFLWARSLMGHAVEYSKKYPDKDFIGLSINATGDAQPASLEEVKKTAPESCLMKINEAIENGIEQTRLVSVISDATSVDLVTEAGAGGRVTDMIENNKNKEKAMAEENEKENQEKKEKHESEETHEDGAAPKDDGEKDGDHEDEDQDIALIKKMIAKYMGDDHDASPEECGVAKEAKDAFGEMGYSEEESEKAAVHAMKLARHMASKQSKESEESEEGDDAPVAPAKDKDAAPAPAKEAGGPESLSPESKKESAALQKEVLKLRGELAKLNESQKTASLNQYVEKLCKESKLPQSATKSFKEAMKNPKSKEQIEMGWKIFLEGYKSRNVVVETSWESITQPEKIVGAVGGKGASMFAGITND